MPPDTVSEGTVVGVVLSPSLPPSLDGGGCAVPGEDVGSSKQPIIKPASKLSGFKSFTIF